MDRPYVEEHLTEDRLEPAPDHGLRRVACLDAGLLLAVAPLVAWLARVDRPLLLWPALAVAVLFVLAEWFPVDIEIGEQAHTVAFTAVPLIVGLCAIPPVAVIGVRLGASLLVLGGIRRQEPVKLATNLVSHLLQTSVAAAVVVATVHGWPTGPRSWLMVGGAVFLAEIAGTLVVTAAIALVEGQFDRELLAGTLTGWATLLPDVTLGLLVALALHEQPGRLVMLAVLGVSLSIAVRAYARVTARYRVLEVLDSFTGALGTAVVAGRLNHELLAQLRYRLHAGTAWIELPSNGRPTLVATAAGVRLADRPPADGEPGTTVTGRIEVGVHSVRVGVADRLGEIRDFDREDQRLFEVLVAHAAVALQNVDLLDQLRDEARRNELLATTDALTGLPNRTWFLDRVDRSITDGDAPTVLLVGLDRFKEVNETLGHERGDELLVEVGRRLATAAGDAPVARLAGDEFAVLLVEDDPTGTVAAEGLLAAVSGLYGVGGMQLDVSATAGLAGPAAADTSALRLLRQADVAMYLAKGDRQPLERYAPDRDTSSPARLAMAGRLRTAIERGDLQLHHQPQIDLGTRQTVGVEALVRWTPPGQAHPVPPVDFIEVAERTGLIHPLTRLVLDRAATTAAAWAEQGLDLRTSVNLSARNLEDPSLVGDLAAVLDDHRLDPQRLEVEVTETSVMLDPQAAIATLRRIHELGVRVAIDDFGTGHSSLAYLAQLPVDRLKIDRSFIRGLGEPGPQAAVVHAVTELARHLGLEVVAEGVETEAQLAALVATGCDIGQGYFWARPMPAGDLERWLQARGEGGASPRRLAPVLPIGR